MNPNFGMSLAEFIIWLTKEFDTHKINYAVMRNYNTLPNKIESEDLDILVNQSDLKSIEEIIWNNNKLLVMDQIMRASVLNFFIHGIAIDSEQDSLQVDFNYNCPWKGFEYLSPADVLNRKISSPTEGLTLNVPDKIDEAIISIFTHYIISANIRERYLRDAAKSISDNRDESILRLKKYLGITSATRVIDLISIGDINGLMRIRKKVCISIIFANLKRHFSVSIYKNIRHFWKEFSLMYFNKHLFTIAILGPDGAGKSTVIESVIGKMKGIKKKISLQHLKPVYINKRTIEKRGFVAEPHAKRNRGTVSFIIKLFVWVVESWVYHLFHKRKNNSLDIFDRHFDDMLVDPIRYRCGINEKVVSLFSYLIPRPNLFFVLTAPAVLIQSRKQEVPFQETERQVNDYRKYAKNNSTAVLIDTSSDINHVTENVLNILRKAIHEHSKAMRK